MEDDRFEKIKEKIRDRLTLIRENIFQAREYLNQLDHLINSLGDKFDNGDKHERNHK